MFDDDETLQMYIEESLDHLADIESDLLAIEESGESINLDLVNTVFRAAHSIKGGAGFMGLTTIKDLAHHLENVLGLIRNKSLTPDSNRINVLLEGFDTLETLIKNIKTSNDMDVSDHISALEAITNTSLPLDNPAGVTEFVDIVLTDGRVFPQVSAVDIQDPVSEGKNLFLVEYDLIQDIQEKGKNPLNILNTLEKTGTIIESRIDFDAVGTLSDGPVACRIPFQVVFASILEYDMTETLFDIEKRYIHAISEDMIVSAKGPDMDPLPGAMPSPKEPAPLLAAEDLSAPPPSSKTGSEVKLAKPPSSLRVNVGLLDTLMNLAGELVLSRNQLLQGISASNLKATELSSQRIDMITSELQEAIMRTRMQPISNILNKFTRVVRDLSHQLGKSINLVIEGKEVELDKKILESISDPLTHLVRNAVDHGIETPMEREQMGKNGTGKIILRAFHEAGQVNIVISDDGKGLDPNKIATAAIDKGLITAQQAAGLSDKQKIELIFMPGFSTAKQITDVSGRGVGMDVVTTNIESLGGIIDVTSIYGEGTDIQIKLPLTLAIIPSQITAVGNERYAVPQVNLNELLRIPAAQIKEKIETVGNADVVRLRGELLPLLDLSAILGIKKTYDSPENDEPLPDRRQRIADRRSRQHTITPEGMIRETAVEKKATQKRRATDRRYHAKSAINIAVVSAGTFKYGLIVDQLYDSEEIVVKPVGRHLKKCTAYAGATIMGDGKVALILDISNLAQMADLAAISTAGQMTRAAEQAAEASKDKAALLIFKNSETEYFAAPLNIVQRIERIQTTDIEQFGNRKVVQYRGKALPLYELSQVADFSPLPRKDQQEVIVFKIKGRELGLMITPPVDALEVTLDIDENTLKQSIISGSIIINGHITLLVDIFEMVKMLNPEWFKDEGKTDKNHQKAPEFDPVTAPVYP
ncbi:chemotaxis protein CheA [Desulfobacula sp.]|uniref:chemotaxis protein CheA n=1 Tax=Desulfobacula sp. TaxID=2593537 RepID=UPI00260CDF9B|nr:chemotaxis protein CheA [Desulfobacula sp.]